MRKRAVPHSVPLSSGAGGGTRRQTCLNVSEFLTSRHWRAAHGSPLSSRHKLHLQSLLAGVVYAVYLLLTGNKPQGKPLKIAILNNILPRSTRFQVLHRYTVWQDRSGISGVSSHRAMSWQYESRMIQWGAQVQWHRR